MLNKWKQLIGIFHFKLQRNVFRLGFGRAGRLEEDRECKPMPLKTTALYYDNKRKWIICLSPFRATLYLKAGLINKKPLNNKTGEKTYFLSSVHITGKAWMLARAVRINEFYFLQETRGRGKYISELVSRKDSKEFCLFFSFRKVPEKAGSTSIHLVTTVLLMLHMRFSAVQ